MMKNPKQFLELIKQYKGESIDENIKVIAKAEIKKSEANICAFTEERHKCKGCLASSKLCLWIANILEFNETYLFVKPLKAKQLQAEKEMQQKPNLIRLCFCFLVIMALHCILKRKGLIFFHFNS